MPNKAQVLKKSNFSFLLRTTLYEKENIRIQFICNPGLYCRATFRKGAKAPLIFNGNFLNCQTLRAFGAGGLTYILLHVYDKIIKCQEI